MIEYPYEKGSAAGFFRNCVAEGSIADPFLFFIVSFSVFAFAKLV